MCRLYKCAALLTTLAIAVVSYASEYSLTLLGPGVLPSDINDSGEIVGTLYDGWGGGRAFRWSPRSGFDLLEDNHALRFSSARAINSRGQIVGDRWDVVKVQMHRAFLWNSNAQSLDLGTLPGYDSSMGMGINDAGTTVGGSLFNLFFLRAFFRQHNGPMQPVPMPDWVTSSWANGINNRGQVVGYAQGASGAQAFVWNRNLSMQFLQAPAPLNFSVASDINDRGQVVGWNALRTENHSTGPFAYVWDALGGMKPVGNLPGFSQSYLARINDAGVAVGDCSAYDGYEWVHEAVVWDSRSGLRNLNDLVDLPNTGGRLWKATGINSRGQIVGTMLADSSEHGFVLTPRR